MKKILSLLFFLGAISPAFVMAEEVCAEEEIFKCFDEQGLKIDGCPCEDREVKKSHEECPCTDDDVERTTLEKEEAE